jgi:hypothetical protein
VGVQSSWFYFNPIEPNGIANNNNNLYPYRDHTRYRLFKKQQRYGNCEPIAIGNNWE